MSYYTKQNGKIEPTLTGQYVLTFLGLIFSDFRNMTKQQLINYIIKLGRALDTGKTSKSRPDYRDGPSSMGDSGIYGKGCKHKPSLLNDIGDQSRYFDLDVWAEHHGILDVPKPDTAERDYGLYDSFITLESYLIDETKCREGKIIRGGRLAQLQVDTAQFQLRAIEEFGTQQKNAIEWNTMLFGSHLKEKYQKDLVSIIKTGINLITALKISNWLTFLLTNEYKADVKILRENGGSHARNVGNYSQLLITINGKTASALGVKNAVSETRLIISVEEKKRKNIHSTVKPIRLMAYLIELGCPRNGVVLDPFVGSGTTCIAAKQLGRRYIGIEIDEEYHRIAEARVAAYPVPLEWSLLGGGI